MSEFRVGCWGSDGDPQRWQQDDGAESDISLTRVTFNFQPCKCPFAKNRPGRTQRCTPCVGCGGGVKKGKIWVLFERKCLIRRDSDNDCLRPRISPDDRPLPWEWKFSGSNPGSAWMHRLQVVAPLCCSMTYWLPTQMDQYVNTVLLQDSPDGLWFPSTWLLGQNARTILMLSRANIVDTNMCNHFCRCYQCLRVAAWLLFLGSLITAPWPAAVVH